jgi:DNA-binding CsgD family transcriptional regulator
MKIESYNPKPWKIPRDLERFYSQRNVEKALSFFDRSCQGKFYMVDYRKQKLILGSTSSTLSFPRLSKDLIELEGFSFYKRILVDGELEWLMEMKKKAHDIFYSYPEVERQNLEFSYDLIAQSIDNREFVLRHKLVPYKLCNNGNMWLGLCHVVTSSFLSVFNKASIINIETGKTYDFINGEFTKSEIRVLTPDEITILTYATQDMQVKQICDVLHISESNLKRKRLALFDKLDVKTMSAAIYKATLLKLI